MVLLTGRRENDSRPRFVFSFVGWPFPTVGALLLPRLACSVRGSVEIIHLDANGASENYPKSPGPMPCVPYVDCAVSGDVVVHD